MKPETKFRINYVIPFLKTLKNTSYFPIQQLAICGDPDFFLCIWGRFVPLELKDRGEKPRKLQEHKLIEIERTGGVSLVASLDNWEQVKTILSAMDSSKERAWAQQSNRGSR